MPSGTSELTRVEPASKVTCALNEPLFEVTFFVIFDGAIHALGVVISTTT